MKSETFDAIAVQTKMEADTIEMARDRLVHGMKLQDVADKHGVTHQLVWQAAQRILTHGIEDELDLLRRKMEYMVEDANIEERLRKRLLKKLAQVFKAIA